MDILEIRRRAKARQAEQERQEAEALAGSPTGSEAPEAADAAEPSASISSPAWPPVETPGEPVLATPVPAAELAPPAAPAPVSARPEPLPVASEDADDAKMLAEFFASDRDAAINRFADPAFFTGTRVYGRSASDTSRFLTCRVGSEEYGIDLDFTREILKPAPLTEVPRAPADVLGVISLRGNVLPVVDLAGRLRMQPADQPSKTERYVVLVFQGESLCARVDAVSGVIGFVAGEIEPPPKNRQGLETDFVAGIGRVDERMIILLNIDEVIGGLLREEASGP